MITSEITQSSVPNHVEEDNLVCHISLCQNSNNSLKWMYSYFQSYTSVTYFYKSEYPHYTFPNSIISPVSPVKDFTLLEMLSSKFQTVFFLLFDLYDIIEV